MKEAIKWFWVGLLVLSLVAVRVFQHLFYDPLIDFYHSSYQNEPLPDLSFFKYLFHQLLRFGINCIISLGIIWIIFRNKLHLKFAMWVFALAGILALALVAVFISLNNPDFHMLLFYSRRILMQPILVFLLIPAFYFQDSLNKQEN